MLYIKEGVVEKYYERRFLMMLQSYYINFGLFIFRFFLNDRKINFYVVQVIIVGFLLVIVKLLYYFLQEFILKDEFYMRQ